MWRARWWVKRACCVEVGECGEVVVNGVVRKSLLRVEGRNVDCNSRVRVRGWETVR